MKARKMLGWLVGEYVECGVVGGKSRVTVRKRWVVANDCAPAGRIVAKNV